MTQESSLTYLNDSQPYGEGYNILIVLPLHLPQELPEYLVYIKPDESIIDLKTTIRDRLDSHPSIEHQKVIFRGRILDNTQKFSAFLNEFEGDRPHFHVVINNLNNIASINTTRLRTIRPAANASSQPITAGTTATPSFERHTFSSNNSPALQNNSLELNHEALQNYLQSIRPSLPSNLASVDLVDHPIFYQFVSVNGQAYLVSVPGTMLRQSNSSTNTTTATTPPVPLQPIYRRAWTFFLNTWPSIWLAVKLLFFYTFLSSGSSIYKQILLGVVAALIFAFQHGVIDIQVEVVRNLPQDPVIPPVPQADPVNQTNDGSSPAAPANASPQQPLHPVLEGIRSFLYSLFPARDVPAENARPQW